MPRSNTYQSIYRKWNARAGADDLVYFARFMNGRLAVEEKEIVYVSLQQALTHLDEWSTDIEKGLTAKERKTLHSGPFVKETLRKLPPVRPWSSELTNSILYKWEKQGGFTRFMDGNPQNCSLANLSLVDVHTAMRHIDDWKVDWDVNLTSEEIALVKSAEWRSGLF